MKTLLFVAMGLLASSTFAAGSGDLLLSGTVVSVNDLVITPDANATNLDILNGEINKTVASVAETSNNLLGYKIMMKSANASKLVHSVDPTKSTDYTITYDGSSAVTLTTSDQEVKNVSSLAGLTTNTSSVAADVSAFPTAPAGTYSDTVTISIVAN